MDHQSDSDYKKGMELDNCWNTLLYRHPPDMFDYC